jgi:hypothetical protein
MPLKLTDEEKAYLREIAFEVADTVIRRHVDSCPYGKKLERLVALALGIGIGTGVIGAVAGKAIVALLIH